MPHSIVNYGFALNSGLGLDIYRQACHELRILFGLIFEKIIVYVEGHKIDT